MPPVVPEEPDPAVLLFWETSASGEKKKGGKNSVGGLPIALFIAVYVLTRSYSSLKMSAVVMDKLIKFLIDYLIY